MISRNTFRNRELDKCDGIVTDFSVDSKAMLITFGGIRGRFGMPIFEFFNLTANFDSQKVYLRDLEQVWYQNGITGIGKNVDQVALYINNLVRNQNTERVVLVGNSAGGYAALLFGGLLRVDEVHAFSPQTCLSRQARFQYGDYRWLLEIQKLHLTRQSGDRYLDLLPVLQGKKGKTRFHIHYCHRHRLDRIHATRLGQCQNVVLHQYESGGHALVRQLRDNGSLARLLLDALGVADHVAS